jgi:hypothetical protein
LSTYRLNTLSISEGPTPITYIQDATCYKRPKTLYWLSSFGGWEWFNFIDYEKTVLSDKQELTVNSDYFSTKQIRTISEDKRFQYLLIGRQCSGDESLYINEMITSPIVIDETGARVRVLTERMLIDAGEILQPEVRIEYLPEKSIRY